MNNVVITLKTREKKPQTRMAEVPHVIPYQGSKRKLAATIAAHFPANVATLYEPFAGSAAVTLYAAAHGLAERFVIADALEPLVTLHRTIVEKPTRIADAYETLWTRQPECEAAIDYFYDVRERYNTKGDPADLLFLILRCVANAVRFSTKGKFSQSPDKRRRGTHPSKIRESIFAVSRLLKGRCEFRCTDFSAVTLQATAADLVYMDPPYQGTSQGPDKRYFQQLDRERLIQNLAELNRRAVPYLVSYDGQHGEKTYGEDLPAELGARKLLIRVGRSTQATLNGQDVTTYESLYLSSGLGAPREDSQLSFALM